MRTVIIQLLGVLAAVAATGCAPTWSGKAVVRGPEVVVVEKPCQIDPLEVPRVAENRCGPEQPGWACYDPDNANLLKQRTAAMERWIAAARKRCGVMEYNPSSYHLLPPIRRTSSLTFQIPLRLSANPKHD